MAGVCLSARAQEQDSIRNVSIEDVVITGTLSGAVNAVSPLDAGVADGKYLSERFTGNLVRAIATLPGVRSMDIGSGFSKPVIRGMGFNRITVINGGVKQEGQQWGADHGLEIDAFDAGSVIVRKGPSSLLYGSDAIGGAVEISPAPLPLQGCFFGEAASLYRSVNGSLGGSLMTGLKKGRWDARVRYSEQHYADYRIPTDRVVYLDRVIKIDSRRLKNTAGYERNASSHVRYTGERYSVRLDVSNAYQKAGFFPGMHGIPDPGRLAGDGDSRNIGDPYSTVNHFRTAIMQQWDAGRGLRVEWDMAWQNNRRKEFSLFHTHYPSQPVPERDPDKELDFRLNTYSAGGRVAMPLSAGWELTVGLDGQHQDNLISGYSFLLPEFRRTTGGVYAVTDYKMRNGVTLSGGVRFDRGRVRVDMFRDPYLAEYLQSQGYGQEEVERYSVRSYRADRRFNDFSASAGIVWAPSSRHLAKANIGRSFRLPGANELAANGVHHGAFRHEQGDPELDSERGWQLDVSYTYTGRRVSASFSPFVSHYSNYIYLRPTGEWSILPHAGQIYRYTGAEALFAGAELSVRLQLAKGLSLDASGDYVYARNMDSKTALSFSPPARLRGAVEYAKGAVKLSAEYVFVARQDEVAVNEDATPGAHIFNASLSVGIPLAGNRAELVVSAQNLFDRRYYDHMSFYRKAEIPEPGRNFQVFLRIPFKTKTK